MSKQEGESSERDIDLRRPEHATSVPFRGPLLSITGWRYTIIGLGFGIVVVFLPYVVPELSLATASILALLLLLLGQALQLDARSQDLDVRTQAAVQDLDASTQAAIRDLDARTQAAVERAQEQADLWRKLEQAPWMSELMKGIIDSAASIDAMQDNKVFVVRATEMLEEWQDSIREISEGQIRVKPERFSSVVMPLVEKALAEMVEGGSIMAVSVWTASSTPAWWYTPAGMAYWKANKRALTRDNPISIKRIFVYQPDSSGKMPKQIPKQLDDLIKEQCVNEHMSIYTVEVENIEAFLQLDMAVFGKHFEFEQRVSHVGEIQEYLCSTSRSDINRRVWQFESIMAKSETEKYNCELVLARKKNNTGHVALSEGNWEEAQQQYEKARELGYTPEEHITFNLAMVEVGKGKYSDALEQLEEFTPPANTPNKLHKTALTMVCKIVEDRADAALEERLKEQKSLLGQAYNYASSPLKLLEHGLRETSPTSGMPDGVTAVFDALKTPTSKKSSSQEPTSKEPTFKEQTSEEPKSTTSN